MGSFLTRFRRKKPTTLEELIKIEESLKKIEGYRKVTEQKQKRTVANILIYGAALYVLACVIVLVWYLPESWLVRLGLLIPFILIPLIIYGMKRFISGYFNSKMNKANKEYVDLQNKKKDIIDNIMETETFNKAKEILSKYAPEKLGRREYSPIPATQSKTLVVAKQTAQSTPPSLRKRVVEHPQLSTTLGKSMESQVLAVQSTRSIPKPMFSRTRGLTDKLIEYIVGDGPSYRFALICKHCSGHNGMALEEEFPYVAYNCCYCLKFNPARSQRPLPPPLPGSNAIQYSLPGISELNLSERKSEVDNCNLNETTSQEAIRESSEELQVEADSAVDTLNDIGESLNVELPRKTADSPEEGSDKEEEKTSSGALVETTSETLAESTEDALDEHKKDLLNE